MPECCETNNILSLLHSLTFFPCSVIDLGHRPRKVFESERARLRGDVHENGIPHRNGNLMVLGRHTINGIAMGMGMISVGVGMLENAL